MVRTYIKVKVTYRRDMVPVIVPYMYWVDFPFRAYRYVENN